MRKGSGSAVQKKKRGGGPEVSSWEEQEGSWVGVVGRSKG